MTMVTINGPDELKSLVGTELGVSDWHPVTQDSVDAFARITGDDQWIHLDVERAKAGPFGGTVAHGFYTVSLAPMFLYEMVSLEGFGLVVNYGLGRVRFPAPMPVGNNVRMRCQVQSVDDVPGGVHVVFNMTFEREGEAKPVCVAEFLSRYFYESDRDGQA